MSVYARFLQIFGVCNLFISILLTIYGYIFPERIQAGTTMNAVVMLSGLFSFYIMLILTVIFGMKLGNEESQRLLQFNWRNGILCFFFLAHMIYRLVFSMGEAEENGSSVTSGKLMATLALALLLNFTTIIVTTNYLKEKQ